MRTNLIPMKITQRWLFRSHLSFVSRAALLTFPTVWIINGDDPKDLFLLTNFFHFTSVAMRDHHVITQSDIVSTKADLLLLVKHPQRLLHRKVLEALGGEKFEPK